MGSERKMNVSSKSQLNLIVSHIVIIILCSVHSSAAKDGIVYSGMDGAMRYLSEFGYMAEPKDPTHMSMAEMKDSIMDFQEMCSLKQTGELDSATIHMMNMPRCANKDEVLHPHRHRKRGTSGPNFLDRHTRSKRYVIHGAKWYKNPVTYRITQYTQQPIPPPEVDRRISRAFQMWERETNIKFQKSEADADIQIRFIHGAHGDNYPFTGDFRHVLAHGFYPGSGLGGDVHFNEAINWTAGNNLLYTAVHEIGHAIGLKHSSDQAAVMFPHYLSVEAEVKLHSDDIAGVRTIYGRPQTTALPQPNPPPPAPPVFPNPPTTTTTTKPASPVSTINPFHGVNPNVGNRFQPKTPATTQRPIHRASAIPVTKSTTLAPIRPTTTTTAQNPDVLRGDFLTRRHSEFCRSGKVDALTTLANGDIYVFRGEEILPLKFLKGEYIPGPILKVQDVYGGKIPGNIDAAFTLSNGKTYIFKGDLYWRSVNTQIDSDYPKKISVHFPGIPNDVDSAFVWSNDKMYFFKGDQYWRFDLKTRPPVDPKYPKPINTPKIWEGVPGDMDAVFRSPQGITYFFRAGRYWRYDDTTGAVAVVGGEQDYPRDARIWWFSCTEFQPDSDSPRK